MDLLRAVKRYYNNLTLREAPLLTEYLHQITLHNSRLQTTQELHTFYRKLKCPHYINDDSKVCNKITNQYILILHYEINRAINTLLLTPQHVKKWFVILSSHVFAPIKSSIMYLNNNEQFQEQLKSQIKNQKNNAIKNTKINNNKDLKQLLKEEKMN